MDGMELRHLRYFVCVAEEQHIGRAAARLRMSQPPLTRQIRKLERELDAALFTRNPRGVELTDAGRSLLDDARRVLDLVDQAGERANRAGQGLAGRIDIAVFGTGIFGAIPRLLRAFRNDHPEVKIVLHNMTKQEQLDALAQRRINLAFNRFIPPTPGLVSETLLTEQLHLAVPADHPLAARTAVRLDEVEHEPMVLFPTGLRPNFIDRVRDMCHQVGFAPNVVAEVADVVHGIALVATGGGLCLVPDSATNLHVPGVTYRPLRQTPDTHVELCCVHRQDDPSPVLARLLESMRATAPRLSAERRYS
jgi:DNA-binding transcriptional LysR family regulator